MQVKICKIIMSRKKYSKHYPKMSLIRPLQITAFIFVLIGVLASICAVFPEDGIAIGNMKLRFPTLDDMLETGTAESSEPIVSPEELLAQRVNEMRISQEAEFVDFFTNNPARIHFPNDSLGFFDDFYAALDVAYKQPLRIVHYGDSQIEEDRISKELRVRLQEQFGGSGVGLLPYRTTYYNLTVQQQMAGTYQRYSLITCDDVSKRSGNMYGPLIQVSTINGSTSLTVSPRKKVVELTSAHYSNQLSVLAGPQALRISVGDSTLRLPASENKLRICRFPLPDSTTIAKVSVSGTGDVYGIMLDDTVGVSVDNIPLRGCSGTIFAGVSADQLSTYFDDTNTRLVILQFGGNSMPGIHSQKSIDRVLSMIVPSVRYMKMMAPDAHFLFIGPSDMTNMHGGMQTYTMLPEFDRQLCDTMNEMGIAYWSLFEAMGGINSMPQWVKSNPRLAGSDYVHFTRKGAEKAGEMLYNAIITGYNYYKMRERYSQPVEYLTSEIVGLDIDSLSPAIDKHD